MNTKLCYHCHEVKPHEAFNRCKTGREGLHNHCRACQKLVRKAWADKNRDHIKAYDNRPDVKARSRELANKRYREDDEFRAKHLEMNKIRRRKEGAKIKQRANEKLRKETNPTYRVRMTLNGRLRMLLKGIKGQKTASMVDLLGCSVEDFVKHLESLWQPGMTWETYGQGLDKWHIDHIRPICSFDLLDLEQQRQCYHYSNMQPLWGLDNLKKGAKLADGTDAREYHKTRKYRPVAEDEPEVPPPF